MAAPPFPGSVGDVFWGGITGPRYFVDPKEKLIGIVFMQGPSIRAAYHAEFRALVYGAMTTSKDDEVAPERQQGRNRFPRPAVSKAIRKQTQDPGQRCRGFWYDRAHRRDCCSERRRPVQRHAEQIRNVNAEETTSRSLAISLSCTPPRKYTMVCVDNFKRNSCARVANRTDSPKSLRVAQSNVGAGSRLIQKVRSNTERELSLTHGERRGECFRLRRGIVPRVKAK